MNALQLIEQSKRSADFALSVGSKDYCPADNSQHVAKLEDFYTEQLSILKEERVTKKCNLSQGEWIKAEKKVVLSKITGKYWGKFGYTEDGKNCLYPEEALFLVDEGILELYHGGIPMSLHQAFSCLLSDKFTSQHYFVYSYLCRYGYILKRIMPSLKRKRSLSPGSDENQLNLPYSAHSQSYAGQLAKTVVTINQIDKEITDTQESPNSKFNFPDLSNNQSICLTFPSDEKLLENLNPNVSVTFNSSDFPLNQAVKRKEYKNSNVSSVSEEQSDLSYSVPVYWWYRLKEYNNWQSLKSGLKNYTENDLMLLSPAGHYWSEINGTRPLVSPTDATTAEQIVKKLDIFKEVDDNSWEVEPDSILYEVFSPSKNFSMNRPGDPISVVFICSWYVHPPDLKEHIGIKNWLKNKWANWKNHIPIHWAAVDNASKGLSFFTFQNSTLPCEVPVAAI